MPTPTDLDIYLFDLRGYLILEEALGGDEVEALNAAIDVLLPLEPGEWRGYVHGHNYNDNDGFNLQQIYEGGEPFERLIDHLAWIEKVKHFVGGEGTFDYNHGPLFIDESFANLRGPGEAIGMHSGGHAGSKRKPVSLPQRPFHGRPGEHPDRADGHRPRGWRHHGDSWEP